MGAGGARFGGGAIAGSGAGVGDGDVAPSPSSLLESSPSSALKAKGQDKDREGVERGREGEMKEGGGMAVKTR